MEYTGPSFSPVVLLRVVRLHWRLGLPAVGHGLGLLLGRAEQRGVARVPPAVELDEGDLGFGRVVASEKKKAPNVIANLVRSGQAVVQSDDATEPDRDLAGAICVHLRHARHALLARQIDPRRQRLGQPRDLSIATR
jgi:hypothetical protein